MTAKKFLTIATLVGSMGAIAGCHYGIDDDRRHRNGYGPYRDGYRDGRAYERRRDDWRDNRYDDRRYDYRRRW